MPRSVAIGLDGTSWNVLGPLLETGKLPNLAALREQGASGVLESTIPFYTGPAWASFATAASPALHGVYDFTMLRDGDEMSVARHSDLRRVTYYEQLAREGKRSVLINLPIDQQEAEGCVIVNSWLTVDEARRIYPLDRRERYRAQLDAYQNYPTTFRADLQTHLEELSHIERRRFELATALFEGEEWDHFFILFSATDWIGHHATGRFLAGDPEARAAFERLYSELDGYVGWFVEHAPDAALAVLSDHGQTEETHAAHVNGLLRELGLVALLRERPADVNAEVAGARTTVRVPGALGRLRRSRLLRPAVRAAKGALQRRGVDLVTPQQGQTVDRVLSRAFSPTTASYAIYTRGCSDEELGAIRDRLLALRLEDGRAAFDGIWTFEELYGHPVPAGGPTFVFAPALGVRPSTHVRLPVIERAPEEGRGAHQRDGFVLLGGPHVEHRDLGTVALYDVTPTLLWATGAGVLAGGDGRVLFEAYDDAFAASQELREVEGGEIERAASADDDGAHEVTARLRALGYI